MPRENQSSVWLCHGTRDSGERQRRCKNLQMLSVSPGPEPKGNGLQWISDRLNLTEILQQVKAGDDNILSRSCKSPVCLKSAVF